MRKISKGSEEPEQLTLMPAPVARSARAELIDAGSSRAGRKKRRNGYEQARFFTWPKDREEVLVLFDEDGDIWLPGYMDGWCTEARDARGGVELIKVHSVRLQPEKAEGLSESLKASLPHYVKVERLDQLRRP